MGQNSTIFRSNVGESNSTQRSHRPQELVAQKIPTFASGGNIFFSPLPQIKPHQTYHNTNKQTSPLHPSPPSVTIHYPFSYQLTVQKTPKKRVTECTNDNNFYISIYVYLCIYIFHHYSSHFSRKRRSKQATRERYS